MTVVVLLLACLAGALPQGDARAERLIGELDGLPVDFAPEAFTGRAALQELIALHDGAVPALEGALKTSPSWSVRASAAYALGEIRSTETLLEKYHDPDLLVRTFVRQALMKNHVAAARVVENGQPVYKSLDFSTDGVRDEAAEAARETVELREPYLTQRLATLIGHLGRRIPRDAASPLAPGQPDGVGEEQLKPASEARRALAILETLGAANVPALVESLLTQAGAASDPVAKADLFEVMTVTLTRSDDVLTLEQRRAWAAKFLPIAERAAQDRSSVELRTQAIRLLEVLAGYGQAGALAALEEVAAKDPIEGLRRTATNAATRMRLRAQASPKQPDPVPPNPAVAVPSSARAPEPAASGPASSPRPLAILAGGAAVLLVLLILVRRRASAG
jgi:HEAT repeat protein